MLKREQFVTTVKANKYPPVWEFSDECPAPLPGKWFPPEEMVGRFLDIFLTQEHFNRIVVWGTQCLNNNSAYKIDCRGSYRVIDSLHKAIDLKLHLTHSCIGDGHMSILFVPNMPDEFLRRILMLGHYAESREVILGTNERGKDPLVVSYGQNVQFLLSDVFKKGERIFTFTHDAEYLLEIMR